MAMMRALFRGVRGIALRAPGVAPRVWRPLPACATLLMRRAPLFRDFSSAPGLNVPLIQSTWKAAVPAADDETLAAVGTLLFERLFETTPEAVALFPFSPDGATRKSTLLYKKHVSGVVKSVHDAVENLSNLEELLPILESLGKRHNNYGVKAEHYDLVGGAFLWTLETALTPKGLWTEEAKEQWTAVWGAVANTMKKGQGLA
eukprot:CAMPEP_0204525704 /NCGR_PEP_ID=MMETSP0661-20131031/8046_1 /ASSEMBLY_ACC=CAM_ASM_000606 /TAXON_ID=109239 /ORGANISM="Alexandrium margalefi, Strain AMGDE01CS-322" /LENGTH=202 /DNA_ID=CAMNT_0051531509 /DNA_START=76 /DNA_END=684 /DNA_ORIENTATION=-